MNGHPASPSKQPKMPQVAEEGEEEITEVAPAEANGVPVLPEAPMVTAAAE